MEQQGHYHLVGIAGVGMSALAEALHDAGYRVSGSDRFLDQDERLPVLDALSAQGIALFPQDGSGLAQDTRAVVVSTAIESDNPDLLKASELNVGVQHRSEVLSALASGKRCVGIAGTAGKTTCTAMVSWFLEQAGLDPSAVNGGALVDWALPARSGAVRRGRSDLFVVETDESDRSLLNFSPSIAMITNISVDHFSYDESVRLFLDYALKVSGPLILGPDIPQEVVAQFEAHHSQVVQSLFDCEMIEGFGHFVLRGERYVCPMPGLHNAQNAFLSGLLCLELGMRQEEFASALASFSGVKRRLEKASFTQGVQVYDDYGHNPAKIAAAWATVGALSSGRVLGVWKPHGFGPLKQMRDTFMKSIPTMLGAHDQLFVLPVFYAGGTADVAYDAEDFVRELNGRGVKQVTYIPSYEELLLRLKSTAAEGDVVLCMGARDPALPRFAHGVVL